MFGEMKYWLLLFVTSVILPATLYWMVTIARVIQAFHKSVCACACTPLCLIVSPVLQWRPVTPGIMFSCLSLAFVTANFIFCSSSVHTLSRHTHGLGVPFVWQLLLRFCAFSIPFIHSLMRSFSKQASNPS